MAGPQFKKLRRTAESDKNGNSRRRLFESPQETATNASRQGTEQPVSRPTSERLSCESSSSAVNRDRHEHETNNDINNNNGSRSDSEEDENEQANESTVGKIGRGVGRCLQLEKHVERFGKLKLTFVNGKTQPKKFSSWFSDAIGYTIRTSAELEEVSQWKEVPETNKEVCRTRLLTWFDIEEWGSERIKHIINFRLQNSYRQWRNALKEYYDDLKIRKIDPSKKSPRPEVTLEKWLSVCDWLDSDKFKIRSNKNKKNREKMTSIHTSGRIIYHTHYENMPENQQCKIELFRITHVNKKGEFPDPKDETDYNKMVALKKASLLEGAEPKSDDQILEEVLGLRSGYQKGMGYGVKTTRCYKFLCAANEEPGLSEKLNETQATLDATQSKLEDTQSALENAEDKICSLSKQLEEEKEKNDKKFETLQRQIEQMQRYFRQ